MTKELNIIIACGCGFVTSTIIKTKVQKILTEAGISARLATCSAAELESRQQGMDLVLLIMKYNKELIIPHLNGIALMSEVGADPTAEELVQKCRQLMTN